MMMAKALSTSSMLIGLNENVTLAILGATMRIQYKWPASMRSLKAWVPMISSNMMGINVQVELVQNRL